MSKYSGDSGDSQGYRMSDDGRFRIPYNYDSSNPRHRMNAKTIAWNQDKSAPAGNYTPDNMGIYDNVVVPLVTAPAVAVGVAAYPINQARMAAKGLANAVGARTPSGIPESEKRRLYTGKSFVGDANSLVKGVANRTGYRTPSGLSQEEKESALDNPSDDYLTKAQQKWVVDRKGFFKGGKTRRVRITHKRKSGKKSKGRKTLHKRKSRKSRKTRK